MHSAVTSAQNARMPGSRRLQRVNHVRFEHRKVAYKAGERKRQILLSRNSDTPNPWRSESLKVLTRAGRWTIIDMSRYTVISVRKTWNFENKTETNQTGNVSKSCEKRGGVV